MSSNPFAALFNASEPSTEEIAINTESHDVKVQENYHNLEAKRINNVIENIFGFTVNKDHNNQQLALVFLQDYASDLPEQYLTVDLLGPALFDRLMLDDSKDYVIPQNGEVVSYYTEKEILIYLFNCYQRLKTYENIDKIREKLKSAIIQNAVLLIQQPEYFAEQVATEQIMELIKDVESPCHDFFEDISANWLTDSTPFLEAFTPFLKLVHMLASRSSLVNVDPLIFRTLEIFTMNEKFASALLEYNTPAVQNVGINYANTLFGALLSISVLPKTLTQSYEYFDNPMDNTSNIIENNLWHSLDSITDSLHFVFMRLLRLKEAKIKILEWIANCLKLNANRGKLWSQHMLSAAFANTVSDGFMVNLANITLRLCQPFCVKLEDKKILKVDPTYCAVPEADRQRKNVNMHGLSTETCLIPTPSEEIRLTAETYNFVTESFFLAHRALDIGFRICVDNLVQLNQELSQIQRSYNDALAQASDNMTDLIDTIKNRMEDGFKRYRSLRAVLIEPKLLAMLSQFHKATATWLVQVCIHNDLPNDCYAPINYQEIDFPMPEEVPDTLKSIPEFVVENTVGYLSFLRRFHPQVLEEQGLEFLTPILTMVLTFMGSPQRMKNPHLRARMAECLEALLPDHKDVPTNITPLGKFQRESLFKSHPHRKYIVENLLDVFVSIEMTGQSVQFEQKFNYRRPMYIIMDYLWQLDDHRDRFKELAMEAEENINAVTPPLFLRFVNLLMNDAVFLLDESLSNMAQIRTMQTANENGEWNSLPAEERTQNLSYMHHLGMIAKFDNILGRETIHTLEFLTSDILIVFTHTQMVDRVAAMLNYFLYNLVGPNKKNLKVKGKQEYEFDPANTVLNICKIYVHLYENDSFCLAISQDGRSYCPQLFNLAEDVLVRIGGGGLISELQVVAEKVARLATQQKAEDEILTEAPEEFLDPIMSTLMTDPVILPSSKQIVDRTTIARHILSDQTDPFNRSPLTMDQLIPATELLGKIQAWIAEKKRK